MIWNIRWYPVGEPVQHLVRFEPNGAPVWGSFDDAAVFYDHEDEAKMRAALAACRAFHGREEDIVSVKRTRVRRVNCVPTLPEGDDRG